MLTRPTQDQIYNLLHLLLSRLRLGTDKNGNPYAVITLANTNPKAVLLNDTGKVRKIILQEAKSQSIRPTSRQMEDLQNELLAHAEASDEKFDVSLRVKSTKDGVEIDIGNEHQQVIKLSDGQVSVLDTGTEALFHQPSALLPFAVPSQTGDINLLLPYLNMSDIDKWILIAWLCYVLSTPRDDNEPIPILVLIAGQGSAKTTTCKLIIRSLIDPSRLGVQGFPKNRQDMVIASQHAYILIYDNLRVLSPAWSDTLCMTSTGGSDPTRKLYTDSNLVNHSLKVPLVLNGIHDFITEPDLAQRCVRLELNPICETDRKDESTLHDEFMRDLPRIFRGLLDLTAQILVRLDSVTLTHPQRMLRFVKYLAAIEQNYNWSDSPLQQHYDQLVRQSQDDTVLDDPLASTLCEMIEDSNRPRLDSTPSELLIKLRGSLAISDPRLRQLPQNPIALSKRLKSIQTTLKSQGIDVQFTRGKERKIIITNEDIY